MEPPLCWITNSFDRSPAELLWVTSEKWGPLKGSLLNLSYGYGKVFVVPYETVPDGDNKNRDNTGATRESTKRVREECVSSLCPASQQASCGDVFILSMAHCIRVECSHGPETPLQSGGLYRIRATGQPVYLPIGLSARKNGMQITFSGALDATTTLDSKRFIVRTWSLKRSADYGSKHYDETTLAVASVKLSEDQRTVILEIPDIKPTWCMSIEYKLTDSNGEPVNGVIHNTIHSLGH